MITLFHKWIHCLEYLQNQVSNDDEKGVDVLISRLGRLTTSQTMKQMKKISPDIFASSLNFRCPPEKVKNFFFQNSVHCQTTCENLLKHLPLYNMNRTIMFMKNVFYSAEFAFMICLPDVSLLSNLKFVLNHTK